MPAQAEVELLPDGAAVRVVMARDPDPYLVESDRALAAAMLLLTAGVTKPDVHERLNAEIEDIRRTRRDKFKDGPYLILSREGTPEGFTPQHERDMGSFVACFDACDKKAIQDATEPLFRAALSAVAIAHPTFHSIEKVTEGLVFLRPDGKPVYSYTLEGGNATMIVASRPTAETAQRIGAYFERFAAAPTFQTVHRLFVQSLMSSEDSLRAFLFGWFALEIFVNKAFSDYEAAFFEALGTNASAARLRYVGRVQDVMRDKYTLADRFALIASVLASDVADIDLTIFTDAKRVRDRLLHGEDLPEGALPIKPVHALLQRYLAAHFNGGR